MMQVLFRIPLLNLPVYGYGLMMVVGFFLGIQLCLYLAKRSGLNPETFMNAGLLGLISGILGARLSHIFENLGQYTSANRSLFENLKDAANISSGGLTYYGGFLLAFPTLVIYARRKSVPIRLGMDIIAPGLMVGLAFGRVGCLLNGCCYGAIATNASTLTITFPYDSIPYQDQYYSGRLQPPPELLKDNVLMDLDSRPPLKQKEDVGHSPIALASRSLPLIPAQIYSTITALLIAAMCTAYFTLPHAPGQGFALMMTVEGITRFILEMLRAEPPVTRIGGYGFSLSMLLGAGLFVGGVVLWFAFATRRRQVAGYPPLPQFALAA